MKGLKRTIYFISFPMAFIGFILPIYALSLGANVIEIGYIYSIFSIASIIFRPIVGNLIDKKGRKTGIVMGLIFYAMTNCIFLFGNSFRYLLIARTLQGIASSFLWISVDTTISDISNSNNRSENFGSMDESINKGQMVGSFIGFTILLNNYSDYDFQLIFEIFLITSLIGLYYGIKTVPETIHFKKEYQEGKIKGKKNIRRFLIIVCIISFISSLTAPIYLIYLQDNISNDLKLVVFLFIPGSILSMFLPSKFGALSDKYGREKIILIGLLLSSILSILITLNNSFYSFSIIFTMISIVNMFYGPAFSSIIMEFIGEEKRGKSYGQYSLATGIGASIGPIVGSYIYKNIGNRIVFYVEGILLIGITAFLFYIYTKKSNTKIENIPRKNIGGK